MDVGHVTGRQFGILTGSHRANEVGERSIFFFVSLVVSVPTCQLVSDAEDLD